MSVDTTKVMILDKLYKESLKKEFKKYEIPCIKCIECGKVHDPNEKTFITVMGNITIGLDGGLVGNNFDEKGKVFRFTYFCISCFEKFANKQNK